VHPLHGLGVGVDQDAERGLGELVEVDDQGGAGIDLGMSLKHGFHVGDDGGHLVEVGIADADGFLDAPVGHARRVFHHDGGEQGVGDVDRVLVEGTHPGMPPADVFDRALDFLVG